jgi:hypothetical protein
MTPLKTTIIGWYTVLMGILIILLWTFILKPASQEEGRMEMGFHLMSEFLMACFCIAGGVKLFFKKKDSSLIIMLAHGMIIYSTANAAGYYGEREIWTLTIMFLFLFSISLGIISIILRFQKQIPES